MPKRGSPEGGSRKRVSVVIPAYNAEAYLAESVLSVLSQDHPDVECVVVDDGSTDDTPDIARSFGERIVLVRRGNSGCAAPARNAGIEACTGVYVAFHDADDVLLPGALSALARALDEHPDCGLCVADHANFDHAGERPGHFSTCPGLTRALAGRQAIALGPRQAKSLLLEENFIGCCHAMVRRELLDQGLRFETSLFGGEDFHFFYRALGSTGAVVLGTTFMRRRLHESNATRQTARMLQDMVKGRGMLARLESDPELRLKLKRNVRDAAGMLLWHKSRDGDWPGTFSAMRDFLGGAPSPASLAAAGKALARCLLATVGPAGR